MSASCLVSGPCIQSNVVNHTHSLLATRGGRGGHAEAMAARMTSYKTPLTVPILRPARDVSSAEAMPIKCLTNSS